CVCGVKVLRTLADDRDNEEQPEALPAAEKKPVWDREFWAAADRRMKEREAEKAEKAAENQAARDAIKNALGSGGSADFLTAKWAAEQLEKLKKSGLLSGENSTKEKEK